MPSQPDLGEPVYEFVCRFLLGLSRAERFQVMSMGKFGPAALNFGLDFWAPAALGYLLIFETSCIVFY